MLKKTVLILLLLLVVGIAAMPASRYILWDSKKRPRLELPQAIVLARDALNKQEDLPAYDDRFYCLGASLATTTSKDGDWTFTFGSKENGKRWVIVDLDGVYSV